MQKAVGRSEYRATLLDAVEIAEQLDADLLADAALGFVWLSGYHTGDADANRVAATALQHIPVTQTAKRALLLAALCETYDAATQTDERHEVALQALETVRFAGDDAAMVEVINVVFSEIETPDRREETIKDLEEALVIADRIGDPVLRLKVRRRAIWGCYQRADIERADQLVREVGLLAEAVGLPDVRYEAALVAAGWSLLAGDVGAAESANQAVLDFGTAAGSPDALAAYGGVMYAICQNRGTTEDIAEYFLEAARDNPSIAALRSTVPEMLCELGRIEEASKHLEAEAAKGFDYPYDGHWLSSMVNLTDAAVTTHNREAVEFLLDCLRPYADHVISPQGIIVTGAVARPLARAATLLGEYEAAEAWFAISHDLHSRLGAPFWATRGQLDHADLCLTRRTNDDLEKARSLATTAAATAAEYGCAGLSRRAAALLTGL